MDSINQKTGIIRITNETPDIEAIAALLRAFFAFTFGRKAGQFTEVVFRNRDKMPFPDEEIIITTRTPDPMTKLRVAFRSAWAKMNANQRIRIVIRFEIGSILED